MKLSKKNKAMLASYGRSVLGAVAALYIAGVTDPKELWAALVAALAPVALRAVNPNDPAFGRLPKASVFEKAMKDVKSVAKKPAKKPTRKSAKKADKESKLYGYNEPVLYGYGKEPDRYGYGEPVKKPAKKTKKKK